MSEPTPNGAAEPAKVASDVAAANAPATPSGGAPSGDAPKTPAQGEQPAPEAVPADALSKEIAPPAPAPAQPAVSDEDRAKDTAIRKAKFDLQTTTALKKTQKMIEEEGKTLEEAIDELDASEHIKGHVRNVALGKDVADPAVSAPAAVDPYAAAKRVQAETEANGILAAAITAHGLNVNTAEANAKRKSLIAKYHELSNVNGPVAAARYAMFDAGFALKEAKDAAHADGVKNGHMAVPPPGTTGAPPTGTVQPGTELTSDQVKGMTLEQLRTHDKKVAGHARNTAPMIV